MGENLQKSGVMRWVVKIGRCWTRCPPPPAPSQSEERGEDRSRYRQHVLLEPDHDRPGLTTN